MWWRPGGQFQGVNSRIEHKTSGLVCVNNTVAMSSSSLSGAGDMPRAILTVNKVSLVDTLIVPCAILPRKKVTNCYCVLVALCKHTKRKEHVFEIKQTWG